MTTVVNQHYNINLSTVNMEEVLCELHRYWSVGGAPNVSASLATLFSFMQ